MLYYIKYKFAYGKQNIGEKRSLYGVAKDDHKKFSIGLTLDATICEYKRFFENYHPYIDNLYFSLPLGYKHHSRRYVAEQFAVKKNEKFFWQILEVAKAQNIQLEVLFNTHSLASDDIMQAREMLDHKNISVQKVSLLDRYYKLAQMAFSQAF